MQYFALLISQERDLTPEEGAAEMAAYGSFHAKAASAIRGGDALLPAATAVRITGGPDAPIITDGPFAEGAEVAGGYYVFEAENLDEALALARDIPAAKYGAVEVWPMATSGWSTRSRRKAPAGSRCCWNRRDTRYTPGTPEWEAMAARARRVRSRGGRCTSVGGAASASDRRRRRPCGCATARSSSPTGRTSKAPKSPTASMCWAPPTATRPSRSRR